MGGFGGKVNVLAVIIEEGISRQGEPCFIKISQKQTEY
jgi:hypothetical protein